MQGALFFQYLYVICEDREVFSGIVQEAYKTLSPFSSKLLSMVNSSLAPQYWHTMQGTSMEPAWLSIVGDAVYGVEYWVSFCSSSNDIGLVRSKSDVLYVVV